MLIYFVFDENQITSLDLSANTLLETLNCENNLLSSLDLSANTSLKYLFCEGNLLTNLDLSGLTALTFLYCGGNQLNSLDISSNISLGSETAYFLNYGLSINDMPSLYQVCVWTMPFPPAGLSVYKMGSPNVYFTTECSK